MSNTKKESLSEVAYNYIKNNILNLTYPPGSILTESGLAAELNISRMPIRTAVTSLENEGLLISEHYKSIKVKEITKKDILEIYQIRELLEIGALKRIFDLNKTHEYSYRIEEKIVRMRAFKDDFYKWEQADTELHMEIVSVYENERINRIYINNQNELIRIGIFSKKSKYHIENTNKRLENFVEYMRNNSFNEAFEILMTDHITLGKNMGLKEIEKYSPK